jgi:hypothetical protein
MTKTPSSSCQGLDAFVSKTPPRNNNTPTYRFFSKLASNAAAVPVIKCRRLNGEDFCVPTETSRKQAMEQEDLRVAHANIHKRVEINSHSHWQRLNNSRKINYMDSDTGCSLPLFEGESKRKSFFFWKNR